MKQIRWILILTMLVLTLSACGAGESAQPIPTVVLDGSTANNSGTPSAAQSSSGGNVAASGIVVPVQEAQLAFALAGNVKKVR
jgi:ABC-type oligopeptide transport system substrate-binding subunit